MNSLSIAIAVFIIIETGNVAILYGRPSSRIGNGVGVFDALGKIGDKEQKLFVSYLINWVAGVKLIVLMLLAVVLFAGTETVQLWSVIALIISILSYYWRLAPAVAKLDKMGCITPKGYSVWLNRMIAGFLGMFVIALVVYLV